MLVRSDGVSVDPIRLAAKREHGSPAVTGEGVRKGITHSGPAPDVTPND
jgi:hypothetical protein